MALVSVQLIIIITITIITKTYRPPLTGAQRYRTIQCELVTEKKQQQHAKKPVKVMTR